MVVPSNPFRPALLTIRRMPLTMLLDADDPHMLCAQLEQMLADNARMRQRLADQDAELSRVLGFLRQQAPRSRPQPLPDPRAAGLGRPDTTTPSSSASVQFMITQAMRTRLISLGYTMAEIDSFTPNYAAQLIASQTRSDPSETRLRAEAPAGDGAGSVESADTAGSYRYVGSDGTGGDPGRGASRAAGRGVGRGAGGVRPPAGGPNSGGGFGGVQGLGGTGGEVDEGPRGAEARRVARYGPSGDYGASGIGTSSGYGANGISTSSDYGASTGDGYGAEMGAYGSSSGGGNGAYSSSGNGQYGGGGGSLRIDDERRSRSPGLANNFYEQPISDFKRPYSGSSGGGGFGSGGGGGGYGGGGGGRGNDRGNDNFGDFSRRDRY